MNSRKFLFATLPVFFMCVAFQVQAAKWSDNTATREFYNAAAKLPWDKKLGDWRDVIGEPWGKKPFSEVTFVSEPYGGKLRIDVTTLLKHWERQGFNTEGFFLKGLEGSTVIDFHSQQASQSEVRPKLVVSTRINRLVFNPVNDTYLNSTTFKPLGKQDKLQLTRSSPVLLDFDLSDLPANEAIKDAYLELSVKKIFKRDQLRIGVFEVAPAPNSSQSKRDSKGLAAAYIMDQGIAKDPDVYFASDFEQTDWKKGWVDGGKMGRVVDDSEGNSYQPLSGRSISATMKAGENLALNQRFKFSKNDFSEPQEAYFRYYLRLGDNWNQFSGGKMPGFAGTYGIAGWGSRRPSGTNGWSTRGAFIKTFLFGGEKVTSLGSYVYHLGQGGDYGNTWAWNLGNAALLKNNHWYCIEQYVKLNTPELADGVLKAWLDGQLVFEKTGLKFRTSDVLKIEEVWMNIYHGGVAPSPIEQTAYIDNFVVARKYIGPMRRQ